ncbi:leucine-rich repeat-containing protein 34-like [Agrilus planipennis]|uniref:Leucine-rich repeat-containing protein 34-like n=1 Tax=Agrilus planipennis TaxID=224129 RepID=A0A1W4X9D5_AGRPL|nr:leucine-rich repeat-containing protein 34-like [Agrilus planipennis]
MFGEKLTELFMLLFCEKNSDGTRVLRLKGRDLFQRTGKRIGDGDMYNITQFLRKYPEVIKLDLCYNEIGDDGMHVFVEEYLSFENNLLHLNLVGNNIGYVGVARICCMASTLKLKSLRLGGNKIGGQGGMYVSKMLEKTSSLEYVDLGDTDMNLGGFMHIMGVIRHDRGVNKTLRIIDFSRLICTCKSYQLDSAHLAENLGDMLKVTPTLLELHAQKNELDGHDIELMLIGMSKNNTLLLLDIGFNRFGDHGIELLANWLKEKPALVGLNVAGSGIKNTGARALSFGLPFSKVKLLDITFNKIENRGMLDILNSIKKPYPMRLFYIWGNPISEPSLKIIQRMLRSGVLIQDYMDIRLYTVDGVIYHAFHPVDHFKQKYYCVMDHGCPVFLKIRRNIIEDPYAQPRALIKFKHYPRIPGANFNLSPKPPICDPKSPSTCL